MDPSKCEVLYSKDEMKCGWPAIVTIFTKDQYGEVVHVPNLKVPASSIISRNYIKKNIIVQ